MRMAGPRVHEKEAAYAESSSGAADMSGSEADVDAGISNLTKGCAVQRGG